MATGGATGEFVQEVTPTVGNADFTTWGGDDGLLLVDKFDSGPSMRHVTVGNMCGAPGCKPVVLGSGMVAVAGPGANGQLDGTGDETEADDQLLLATGL